MSSSQPTPRQRRIRFSQEEIQSQLQQLFLFSSLSSASTGDIEALAPILCVSLLAPSPTSLNSHTHHNRAHSRLNIHRSRQQDAYLRALTAFVAEKEKEIEAVCARNYQVRPFAPRPSLVGRALTLASPRTQDFVGSVSALLRVRQGTVSLKHRVVELNDDVQKSGGGVAEKARLSRSLRSTSPS